MDPESKKLLEDTYRLAEDNNKMLHSVRRSMRIGRIMTIIYWVLIIGSAFGAYYFVQPYLTQLIEVYGGTKTNFQNFGSMLKSFSN